jgi:hypothetical protein
MRTRRPWGHILCPITQYQHDACGICLYVDGTDLIHLNLAEEETVEEAHAALQAAVDSWSYLLIATGGALKPEKCFYYIFRFTWDRKGKVSYSNNADDPRFEVTVKLPDGSNAPIAHLNVDKELITLGVASCPSGKSESVLKATKDKALKWANQCKNSHFSPRDVHFSIERKF